MTRAHVVQFGCRLNQYESDSLGAGLVDQGFEISKEISNSDYVIINTCTVTNRADAKNRSTIRRIHNSNPRAKIIVTGCYATTDAHLLKEQPGVYWVVKNASKADIPAMIKAEIEGATPHTSGTIVSAGSDNFFGYPARTRAGNARAYLKIQDGCNKSCSYCKIPQARGKGRSRDFSEVLGEARLLIERGFQELVLTGVNMGWYKNSSGENFYDLVEALLHLEGEFQIRLSSIEPGDVNKRLAAFFKHEKMTRFLHVPLQSGSRQVLKAMRRGYTPDHYRRWVGHVRELSPEVHLGTDVIVGFPGESDELFQETLDFCSEMQFANMHVFSFSKRSNTPVQDMLRNGLQEINGSIIKKRAGQLARLSTQLQSDYLKKTAGLAFKAICIQSARNPHLLTENFLKFPLPAGLARFKHGQLLSVTYDTRANIEIIENVKGQPLPI